MPLLASEIAPIPDERVGGVSYRLLELSPTAVSSFYWRRLRCQSWWRGEVIMNTANVLIV